MLKEAWESRLFKQIFTTLYFEQITLIIFQLFNYSSSKSSDFDLKKFSRDIKYSQRKNVYILVPKMDKEKFVTFVASKVRLKTQGYEEKKLHLSPSEIENLSLLRH